MRTITLYTGGGISLSPINAAGRRASMYTRVIADDGMGITDGTVITDCIDTRHPEIWHDCDAPEPEVSDEEATEADYLAALERMGVNAEDKA